MEAEERKGAGEDNRAEAVKKRSVEEALRREMEEQVVLPLACATCLIRTLP